MSDLMCITCKGKIEQDRIDACADLEMPVPDECKACASKKPKPMAFMGPEGKTGMGHLNVVDPLNKRQLHDVKLWHKRGANHCTAG